MSNRPALATRHVPVAGDALLESPQAAGRQSPATLPFQRYLTKITSFCASLCTNSSTNLRVMKMPRPRPAGVIYPVNGLMTWIEWPKEKEGEASNE